MAKFRREGSTLEISGLRPIPLVCLAFFLFGLSLVGCAKVGPNFSTPSAKLSDQWPAVDGAGAKAEPPVYKDWWKVFNDPVLDSLIRSAYEQNLPLRIAGVRVFEARAQLGVAVGGLFPQTQQAFGSVTYNRESERSPSAPQPGQAAGADFAFSQAQVGLRASWELDFWGKFRRAVESADANLLSSIAAYGNVLVSLTGDVANTYVLVRTLEDRLRIAGENVTAQQESLDIASTRFKGGATSERDVQQALTQLKSTQATIPQLEANLRQAKNTLSILLGLPPSDLTDMLSGSAGIPEAPLQVAVGIPADLLRRRPDVRSAEFQAAAQCAQIGVARADLYPALSLTGSFGFLSSDVGRFNLGDMFSLKSGNGSIGPSVQWNFLNYGRITNNVRVQDARFQGLLITYQNTVLQAQKEVEDGLVAFLKAQERLVSLAEAAEAAKRSFDLSLIQYREGATDYTTVLTAQQALLSQQDNLVVGQGDVPQGLIALYRALGGGWEVREHMDFIPVDIKRDMRNRTNWGNLLAPAATGPFAPAFAPEKRDGPLRAPDW